MRQSVASAYTSTKLSTSGGGVIRRLVHIILGANWFAKHYSARCAMDSRFRGNDSASFVANHFRWSIKKFTGGMGANSIAPILSPTLSHYRNTITFPSFSSNAFAASQLGNWSLW